LAIKSRVDSALVNRLHLRIDRHEYIL
jgi:hypothetical protein